MVMKNPFVTNGYAGPEYFCDRLEETQYITEMLTNENNMALISPRRIGKTELIHHCFAQPAIQKDYYTFIIDIYSTNSVSDLVNMFGKAINYNLNMASDTYETLLRQMPEKQRNVFIAISAEGEARSVKSGAFAKKYHLPSPSSVNSALKGLLEKDFITQQDDAYVVYDKFFDLWLKKYMK